MYKEETFEGAGGVRIFMRSWRPDGPVGKALISIHGFKSHSGAFEWAARQFNEAGVAVYAIDLRGHGRSGGDRLEVGRLADYLTDIEHLEAIVRAREPGVPLFVTGHSAGGVIASRYVLENQKHLAGFICHSFAQEVKGGPRPLLSLLRGLDHIAPHAHVLELKDEAFSRDASVVAAMKSDPLIPRQKYPVHTVAELARAADKNRNDFAFITLPILIMHGTADGVTLPAGSKYFHEHAGSRDKTLKIYEGHYHDLFNDLGRERVFEDVRAWLEARVPMPRYPMAVQPVATP